jgi:hypothetical protein
MSVGLRELLVRAETLAREAGYARARVAWKTNRHGELVVGIIIPPRTPGEWDEPLRATREDKRASRQAR